MTRVRTRRWVWLGVGAAVPALLLVALPAVYFVTVHGCGEAEHRLARTMAREAVLAVAPARGAERVDTYEGCDDDDLFVWAGRTYRYGGPAEAALRRYREAAEADGWRQRTVAAGDPVSGCLGKELGGTTAYLTVGETDGGLLDVSITADRQGSEWC
ncbi:hypothetical protein ACF053_03075 [Streptomyces kanasensis]|uniref:hypothetical protein n=1 Tax=Streptomyces kanasensis TaxID=936756 RepID=UPI0036F6A671